jgi:hypothetical protein
LSGTITDLGAQPLGGVGVWAYAPTDSWLPTMAATSGPDGVYAFPTLPAGSYVLGFHPGPASGIPVQWRASSTRGASPAVSVVDSAHPNVVDEQLVAGSSIAGTVHGPDGQPIGGVQVRAYVVGVSAYFPSAVTTSAADGTYALGGLLPGNYEVAFLPTAGSGALLQWYHGHASRNAADPVTLSSAAPVTGIDVQLDGGSISGNAGGPGVTVAAYTSTDVWVGSFQVQSQADGTYTLAGLPSGTYKIAFFPPSGPPQWYGGSRPTATSIVIVAGSAATGIDHA